MTEFAAEHRDHRLPAWGRIWPAALGVLVAAGTAYRLVDAREVATIVVASGLVYLIASVFRRRSAAWIAFAVTFLLITLDKFAGLDVLPWMLALAGAALISGLALHRTHPRWSFPLQAAAMLLLSLAACAALQLDTAAGGALVAGALLAHAAWDIHHHRLDRVVSRSFAEFCAVLDVLVAAVVAVTAFRP